MPDDKEQTARPKVLLWDDELFSSEELTELACKGLHLRADADHWQEDVSQINPSVVMIDNDFGPEHTPGWIVCKSIIAEFPKIKVISITHNPVARIRMIRDGAGYLPKSGIVSFLQSLFYIE